MKRPALGQELKDIRGTPPDSVAHRSVAQGIESGPDHGKMAGIARAPKELQPHHRARGELARPETLREGRFDVRSRAGSSRQSRPRALPGACRADALEYARRQILERFHVEPPKLLLPDDLLERPMHSVRRPVRAQRLACLRDQVEIEVE